MVSLDISRSFGRVWHEVLQSKLPSFGFCLARIEDVTLSLSQSVGLCLIRALWILMFPKVPYLYTLFFFYLTMILHQSLTRFTALPMTKPSIARFFTLPLQSTANIDQHRIFLGASSVSDLGGISACDSTNIVCLNAFKTSHLFISLKHLILLIYILTRVLFISLGYCHYWAYS